MFTKLFKKITNPDAEVGRTAIDYLVALQDDDFKKVMEAVKLYRKGESLREEYYDKAEALLIQETQDFIPTPAEEAK